MPFISSSAEHEKILHTKIKKRNIVRVLHEYTVLQISSDYLIVLSSLD